MNVQAGDKAVIVFSINPKNVGRIVNVAEYIGKFKEGEQFEAYGMTCTCAVHDHFWWIEGNDIEIQFGPAPKAYIADSWLEPIRPEEENFKETIDINIPVQV